MSECSIFPKVFILFKLIPGGISELIHNFPRCSKIFPTTFHTVFLTGMFCQDTIAFVKTDLPSQSQASISQAVMNGHIKNQKKNMRIVKLFFLS
jgi:hypothetical protein